MKTLASIALICLFGAAVSTVHAQTAAQNKASLQKAYDAINGRDWDTFKSLLADNFTEYAAPQPTTGKDAAVGGLMDMVKAFPDLKITVDKIVADEHSAMAYITMSGTMKGDFMGMPASGKSFSFKDVDILDLDARGKATAHWSVQDPMVMMSQISK